MRYKFNIINMEKKSSAFNKGMRPVMHSLKHAQECKVGHPLASLPSLCECCKLVAQVGWHRALLCEDITYYPNHRLRISRKDNTSGSGKDPGASSNANASVVSSPTLSPAGPSASSSHLNGFSLPSSPFVSSPPRPQQSPPPPRSLSISTIAPTDLSADLDSPAPSSSQQQQSAAFSALSAAGSRLNLDVTVPSSPESKADSKAQAKSKDAAAATASKGEKVFKPKQEFYHTLSFTISFVHDDDTVRAADSRFSVS